MTDIEKGIGMSNQGFKSVLRTVNAAYCGGEGRIDEKLERGERGDGLADFIAVELSEVCERNVCDEESTEEVAMVALGAMERARKELDDVCSALMGVVYE